MATELNFDIIKSIFPNGKLTQKQINGIKFIHHGTADWLNTNYTAYALATTFHETAFTMEPIVERGPKSYFLKYEPNTRIGRDLGNKKKGDGYLFRGRGYVMITGLSNYTKFNIANSPDEALNPNKALEILKLGMYMGKFTGRKLWDYNKPNNDYDFIKARAIINGKDKAEKIAGYAEVFKSAFGGALNA